MTTSFKSVVVVLKGLKEFCTKAANVSVCQNKDPKEGPCHFGTFERKANNDPKMAGLV